MRSRCHAVCCTFKYWRHITLVLVVVIPGRPLVTCTQAGWVSTPWCCMHTVVLVILGDTLQGWPDNRRAAVSIVHGGRWCTDCSTLHKSASTLSSVNCHLGSLIFNTRVQPSLGSLILRNSVLVSYCHIVSPLELDTFPQSFIPETNA